MKRWAGIWLVITCMLLAGCASSVKEHDLVGKWFIFCVVDEAGVCSRESVSFLLEGEGLTVYISPGEDEQYPLHIRLLSVSKHPETGHGCGMALELKSRSENNRLISEWTGIDEGSTETPPELWLDQDTGRLVVELPEIGGRMELVRVGNVPEGE